MAVKRLEISHLRCIDAASLDLDAGRNLIIGANGAGKTSVLEACHVLGRGHSFRVRDNRRLIQRGKKSFLVRCDFSQGNSPGRIGVEYSQGVLDVRIDGRSGRRASQLASALPVEVVDPSAHRLVDGPPGERRRFLDLGLFHVEQAYMVAWQAFRRALVQRNEALRLEVRDEELDVWDETFVKAALELETIRRRFIASWGGHVGDIGERLLGSVPKLVYRSGWGDSGSLGQALREGRGRDRVRGLTMLGPHRSDVLLEFGGGRAKEIASRGQQKLLVAALILGRITDRIARGGTGGLLLVDDPVAELDGRSLAALTHELTNIPVQMLVTAISGEAMRTLCPGRMFHVEQGVIQPA